MDTLTAFDSFAQIFTDNQRLDDNRSQSAKTKCQGKFVVINQ